MKVKLIFISLLLFTSLVALGQDSTEIVIASPSIVAVELPKMNVLYFGVDNPLIITGSKTISSATISNGSITKSFTDPNKYIIRVSEEGLETTVSIYTKGSGGKNELLEQRNYRIKKLPNLEAQYAGKRGSSTITKTELINATEVIAYMGDFPFDASFKILRFDITVVHGGFEKVNTSNSNKITPEQSALLKLMKPGQKVYVENIKVLGPDGKTRNLSPISLKII